MSLMNIFATPLPSNSISYIDEIKSWVTPTTLTIAHVAVTILGISSVLFFGYMGFQCSVNVNEQTLLAFNAQNFTFALGCMWTSIALNIQLVWARVSLC